MPPPSTGIPLPTGTLDSYRSALKAMQKESKAVTQQMAKDAKKGVEISKDLLDRKKAIDKSLAQQKETVRKIDMEMKRQVINNRAEESRAANQGTSAWRKSIQGAMMLHHGAREVHRLDGAFQHLRAGGPDIDKEQGVSDLLHVAQNVPGPIGMVARAMHIALQAVMAIQASIREEARGIRVIRQALNGGIPVEDPDDIKRRDAHEVDKKLSYIDPEYKANPGRADKSLGGGIDPAQFREDIARQIRNENAGILRTFIQGLPVFGGYAQKGGQIWGVDDEAKVNALIETALNQKVPELLARATERAGMGNIQGAQRDIDEIRKIDPRLAPAGNAIDLMQGVQDRHNWATKRTIDQMGVRHIDGRDE